MGSQQETASAGSHSAAGWLLAVLLIGVAVAYYFSTVIGTHSPTQQYRSVVTGILTDNIGRMEIDHFSAPLVQRTPVSPMLAEIGIIPQQFDGFFTLKDRCEDSAFAYRIRHVSDGRVQAEIDGITAMRLRQCL